jgi:hypothetical protein
MPLLYSVDWVTEIVYGSRRKPISRHFHGTLVEILSQNYKEYKYVGKVGVSAKIRTRISRIQVRRFAAQVSVYLIIIIIIYTRVGIQSILSMN